MRDCGAACLASVAGHYGLQLPIAKIRQLCHTDKRGTNALGLIQGLEQMGFNAKSKSFLRKLTKSTSSCYCSYYLQRTIPTLCGYL